MFRYVKQFLAGDNRYFAVVFRVSVSDRLDFLENLKGVWQTSKLFTFVSMIVVS